MSALIAIGASMLAPLGYWATLAAVNGRRRAGEPPLVRGSLPYLGVAVRFGRDATAYVQRCQADHGDVFTLFIAGQRMTFVLDPLAVPAVLRADALSFHPVSDAILSAAFGLDALRARMDLEAAEALGRSRLRGQPLAALTRVMGTRVDALVPAAAPTSWRAIPLYRTIWEIMFEAGTDALFGQGVVTPQLRRDFERFDADFPQMVARLPRALVRDAEQARQRLGRAELRGECPSQWLRERQPLLDPLPEPERGRALVPILWAIHANTIPATFWSLHHLLRDPAALDAIRDELDRECPETERPLDVDALGRLQRLDSAIHEALRLSSGSLTIRAVLEPTTLETASGLHHLRRGDRVCLAPFITHRDPDIFEDPLAYRFDRFHSPDGRRQFYKHGKRVPLPLMPFGAGASMCPGRFFAIAEIKLFIARALRSWDFARLDDAVPDFEFSRAGLGVYPPAHDVEVCIRRKR